MKARYLVTAVGGDIGSAVIRHLGKEFSKESLLGCDITPYVSGRDSAGEFFLVPPYTDGERYIDFILRECRKRRITHILPMTEGEILIFDRHRHSFAREGIRLMIQDSNVLKTAMSKYRTASAVKAAGLKSPKTWKPGDKEEIRYPVVVKADYGCGSESVRVVNNRLEYDLAVASVTDAVVQEYVGTPEDEYTMGVFSNGRMVKSIAFRRTLLGGMTCMAELVEDEKLVRIAEIIAKSFGLKGSINIQMRKQAEDYYIFEINPRISSTVGFRHLLGFRDVLWWLDLLDGTEGWTNDVSEHPPVVGVRTFGEKIFRGCSQAPFNNTLPRSARGGGGYCS